MTYLDMKREEARSMSMRITYLLKQNENIIDDEIGKLMDEYKAKRDEILEIIAEETRYAYV